MKTLLIPEKDDTERNTLAAHWEQNIGSVKKVGKFWIALPKSPNEQFTIYGNDTFSLVLAQVMGLDLLTVQDQLISEVSENWTKRAIKIDQIKNLTQSDFPVFIKPVTPKLFKSSVYSSLDEFVGISKDLEDNTEAIVSEIVAIQAEVRCFILDGKVMDLAFYEGKGSESVAIAFVSAFLREIERYDFPRTFVLDLGFNEQIGFFIIEFNSTWGSGLNGCAPEKIAECVEAATLKPHK